MFLLLPGMHIEINICVTFYFRFFNVYKKDHFYKQSQIIVQEPEMHVQNNGQLDFLCFRHI